MRRKADHFYSVVQGERGATGYLWWFDQDGYLRHGHCDKLTQGVEHFSGEANANRFCELMGEDFEAWLKL